MKLEETLQLLSECNLKEEQTGNAIHTAVMKIFSDTKCKLY